MTTEAARLKNQQHFIETLRREGLTDDDGKLLWPEDEEGRASMGRALFGFALINGLDYEFVKWRERAENVAGRSSATPGSSTDRKEREWGDRFAQLSNEQRQLALDMLDEVLHSFAFEVGVMFDQFDFGELSIRLTADASDDDDGSDEFTVEIQPQGILDMHDEVFGWEKRFGRGEEIGRMSTD